MSNRKPRVVARRKNVEYPQRVFLLSEKVWRSPPENPRFVADTTHVTRLSQKVPLRYAFEPKQISLTGLLNHGHHATIATIATMGTMTTIATEELTKIVGSGMPFTIVFGSYLARRIAFGRGLQQCFSPSVGCWVLH